jgi:cob(I)alamin adenosyltransferase
MSPDTADMTDAQDFISKEGAQQLFRHHEKRLTSLELTVATMETDRAVSEEKLKFMNARFDQIDRRLEKIDGHVSRLVWLIIAAMVGGVMSFLMQGGTIALH